ncbi:MAG: hypothetical protein ACI90V_008964, partial [Bacillariaceae sp.]|jgi:hypothetical protein
VVSFSSTFAVCLIWRFDLRFWYFDEDEEIEKAGNFEFL